MNVLHGKQFGTRSAVIALLCSVTLHIYVIFLTDMRRAHSRGEITTLQVSLTRPSSDFPHTAEPLIGAPRPKAATFNIPKKSSDAQPLKSKKHLDAITQDTIPDIATYFQNNELDVRATPLFHPKIIFPEQAFISKISGKVKARVFIDFEGRVHSVFILESKPEYPAFEKIAINALKETRYSPAMRFGRAVGSQQVVEVVFNPYEDLIDEPPSRPPSAINN